MKRTRNAGRKNGKAIDWTALRLHIAVDALYREVARRLGVDDAPQRQQTVHRIVALGVEPEILSALCGRTDPAEAIRDLCTRYAFDQLMVEGHACSDLDPLSQAMIQRALDTIYGRAAQVARRYGEDPLSADMGLLISLCKSLSRYVPRKPMRAHIDWKLNHYEGAVSRAIRQIENLVKRPEVREGFVAYVLASDLEDEVKARLALLARGGGRRGLDPREAIRFFARPRTVAFVVRYADTVQTARTLYDEETYEGISWHGKRRLPVNRRQGYIDAAYTSLRSLDEASLDEKDEDGNDLHEGIEDPKARLDGRLAA